MPRASATNLTERQQKWFASVEAGILKETGRSIADWVPLVSACPATGHRARLAWMKETYGIGQNRASAILNAAFPPAEGWSSPETLAASLWSDARAKAIRDAVEAAAMASPGVIVTQRKGYTAFSRSVQFAAIRPDNKGAAARLGLGIAPETNARLAPAKHEGWSERLKSVLRLTAPNEVDAEVTALLRQAWEGAA